MIKIVWPQVRTLTNDQVATMYADACGNNKIAMKVRGRLDTPDAYYAMALALDDAGLITLAEGRMTPPDFDTAMEEGTRFERLFDGNDLGG